MDIIKFINSKDIAEHLQKIKYKFSPIEAMLLIHLSRNISLKEKHEAYKELIRLYPDCVVEQRRSDIETQKLSSFLTELIKRQNNLIEKCQKEGDKAFYFSAYFSKEDGAWVDERDYYNAVWETYRECFKDSVDEYAQKIKITKKYIENCDYITLTLLPDGTILDVQCPVEEDPYIDYFE